MSRLRNPSGSTPVVENGDVAVEQPIGEGQPQRPQEAEVHGRLGTSLRSALRLAVLQGVQSRFDVRKVTGNGVLDFPNPVVREERQRHRLRLERGLVAEQVVDRTTGLASPGGYGAGVETGERTDRDGPLV
jgi:hypothetical protein